MGIDGDRDIRSAEPPERPRTTEQAVVIVAAAPSIATPSLLLPPSSFVVPALTSRAQPSLSPTPFPPPPAETAVLLRADAAPPTFPPSRVSVSWRGESIEGEGGASAGLILMAGINRPLIFYCQFFQWRSIGFSPQQICKQNQSIANYRHVTACAIMSTTP